MGFGIVASMAIQKWEYAEATIRNGCIPYIVRPGAPKQEIRDATPQTLLGLLGDEGWELSGIVGDSHYALYAFFFKRPKA